MDTHPRDEHTLGTGAEDARSGDAGQSSTAVEDAVAADIRRRRLAAGWSQNGLAKRAGFARQYISRAENPIHSLPSENLIAVLDAVLDAKGELVGLWRTATVERRSRRGNLVRAEHTGVMDEDAAISEQTPVSPADAVEGARVSDWLVLGVLDPEDALDAVDALTVSVIDRYEVEGPSLLVTEVGELRAACRDVAARTGRALRTRLACTAARQAGLLAYMSVNLGRPTRAQPFITEASLLAAAAGDNELLAWIKGTQSFAAYYEGRYRDALRLAQAGLRIGGAPGQRARLLSNGVARAAGRLGETRIVQQAVDDALDVTADTALTSCISFGPYGRARTMANAATAYLAAGRLDDVLAVTDTLDRVVDQSESDWSRALVRLDTASAHARRPDADLDHAAALGLRALHDSRSNPIASISTRATDLVADLTRRAPTSTTVSDLGAALHTWQAASGLGT